jgi:hypothetical protein
MANDPFKDTRDPLVRTMERNAVLAIQHERDRYKAALENIAANSKGLIRRAATQALYPQADGRVEHE